MVVYSGRLQHFFRVILTWYLTVQGVIHDLADSQAAQLQAAQKINNNKNLSDEERAKRIAKQKKMLRKELEVVAKGIADKCVAAMDDPRLVR